MMVTAVKRSAATRQWVEKTRRLGTLRNVHFAGVAILGVINLYLLVHMAFAWSAANSDNAKALTDQKIAMNTAEIARQPLEGLDEKLAQATLDSDRFYGHRLPFADSEVAGELGALAKKQGVKLTRVQYAHRPVMDGTAGALTETEMDASLSGDYRPLVLFINNLERDKMFFLINAVTLTGQQSGTVGLRLRLTTYLRPPVGPESSEKSVSDVVDRDAGDTTKSDAAGTAHTTGRNHAGGGTRGPAAGEVRR